MSSRKILVRATASSSSDTPSTSEGVSFADKSVSEKYQKKSHLEHIFDLPDTYIGSTEELTQDMWVYNEESQSMEIQSITYIPGLYKIFDEVLVNANDHRTRCPNVKTIRVDIEEGTGRVRVWNDGDGIDVAIHEGTGQWIPEMLFNHLLTSANYDQSEERLTGGKNGYGAKLANIFSTWFRVETVDATRAKRFVQVTTDNMRNIGAPEITASKLKPYTSIEFIPDFKRFHLTGFTPDILKVFQKRVYDLAATAPDVAIYLNGTRLAIKNFERYMELYIGSDKRATPRVYEAYGDRWEIGACTSPDGSFQQISFVNGIWTMKGGKHVDYIAGQLARKVAKYINDRKKRTTVQESYVRHNIWVFIRCMVVNPSFSSQTKEELTTVSTRFGSKCEISDEFVERLAKSGVMDKAIELMAFKEREANKRTDGKKRATIHGIPKLDDANRAGGPESYKCTLILTEGDSAKSSVISGLSVIGRDYYGVFPLKGKLLNVRDITDTKLNANEEINNIKKIMGLQTYEQVLDGDRVITAPKVYKSARELRYGRIMIMTDSDVDGSHIKGLLMNFFHYYWPSLFRIPGFLIHLKTPLVKASRGKQTRQFYTMNEYEAWRESGESRGWEVKYFKGLGTSLASEFKEYFTQMDTNLVEYIYDTENAQQEEDSITLAFSRTRRNDRKQWLLEYNMDPEHNKREITDMRPAIRDFVHRELVHFSNYDCTRSLPNLMDGLKPSQRKILFGCFKRNLRKEIKVAQLAGYISEHAAYHHGEKSLEGAIVKMAQNFVGSNNINLLEPNGQFGTRILNGEDHASARYIFTLLSEVAGALYPDADFPLLRYLDDDGTPIEPEYYTPILPMSLVNGSDGIGTGFRSKIPMFNPLDILREIRARLADPAYKWTPIHPWYRGFDGSVELVDAGTAVVEEDDDAAATNAEDGESFTSGTGGSTRKYLTRGRYVINGDTIRITELPIGSWTQRYREMIERSIQRFDEERSNQKKEERKQRKQDEASSESTTATRKGRKPKRFLGIHALDVDNHSTDYKVDISIHCEKGWLATLTEDEIYKTFKLIKPISLSCMYLYDSMGEIHHYLSPEEILSDFYTQRIQFYEKRKAYLLRKMERDCIVLRNRVQFVQSVLDERIRWNQPLAETNRILAELGLWRLDTDRFDLGVDFQTGTALPDARVDYGYLLEMKIHSLTQERVERLRQEYEEYQREYRILEAKTPADLWMEDLDRFQSVYTSWLDRTECMEAAGGKAAPATAATKRKPRVSVKPESSSTAAAEPTEEPQIQIKRKITIRQTKDITTDVVKQI